MSEIKEIGYPSADGVTKIHALAWIPETEPVAVLQIVHGMQEFIERYDDFARFMCDNGFVVVANDHLGHGGSVTADANFGYFSAQNGNKNVIRDMRELQRRTQSQYPNLPYFMLGHSMGSFLARQYICLYGSNLDGAIISGTAWHPAAEATFGMLLCSLMAKVKGWKYRSPFINNIAVGSYNKRFEPARTVSDWLTRDESVVDAYIADRRTQFMFTLNGYYNMFRGLKFLTKAENIAKVPKNLPIFLIAGQMDPVGAFGEGVKATFVHLQSAGIKDVKCRLYPNDRHEVLNELDKQDVYNDVLDWIKEHMPKQ